MARNPLWRRKSRVLYDNILLVPTQRRTTNRAGSVTNQTSFVLFMRKYATKRSAEAVRPDADVKRAAAANSYAQATLFVRFFVACV